MVDLHNVSTGRGERTQTFDLTVPNRARYQLRHTPEELFHYTATCVINLESSCVCYDISMISQITNKFFRSKSSDRIFWITFVASIIVASAGGLIIGLQQSLWFDDDYSVLLATKSVGQLVHLTSVDVHPPLYYLLLKGWGMLFGWTDLAMRSLSVLFTVGALAVGGLLVRKMFGNRAAIGAMLLVMIAPLLTRYGFEVRMYAMASFIGISATYALYSAWKSRGNTQIRWLVLYASLVILGLYTLYSLALLWIAHAVWIVYVTFRKRQTVKDLLPYIVAFAASVVVYIPWLPTFVSQLSNGALGPIMEPLKLDQLVGIFSFNTVYLPTDKVNVMQTAILVAVVGVYIWAIPKARKKLKAKDGELALLWMYMAVPITVMMVVSLSKAMYVERYLSHVAIGLVLLGAVILVTAADAAKKKWHAYLAYVIVFGAMLVGIFNLISIGNFSNQHQYKPTAREVASSIGSCPRDAMVLADGPYVASEVWFYMQHCNIYFTSQSDKLGGGFAPLSGSKLQVKDTSKLTNKKIIYVSYGQPTHPLPDVYAKQQTRTFGSMDVTTYERTGEAN